MNTQRTTVFPMQTDSLMKGRKVGSLQEQNRDFILIYGQEQERKYVEREVFRPGTAGFVGT